MDWRDLLSYKFASYLLSLMLRNDKSMTEILTLALQKDKSNPAGMRAYYRKEQSIFK